MQKNQRSRIGKLATPCTNLIINITSITGSLTKAKPYHRNEHLGSTTKTINWQGKMVDFSSIETK